MMVGVADTHAAIWYLASDKRLSVAAKNFMAMTVTNGHEIGISSITLIEMVYLLPARLTKSLYIKCRICQIALLLLLLFR